MSIIHQARPPPKPKSSANGPIGKAKRTWSGGVEVKWQEFRGGHEIPPLVLEQLAAFIRARFSSPGTS